MIKDSGDRTEFETGPRGDRLAKVCGILRIDEKDLVIKKFKVIIYK